MAFEMRVSINEHKVLAGERFWLYRDVRAVVRRSMTAFYLKFPTRLILPLMRRMLFGVKFTCSLPMVYLNFFLMRGIECKGVLL